MTGLDATRKIERLVRNGGWTRDEIASAVSVTVGAMDKWKYAGVKPRAFTARALRALKPKVKP
jgi:hypothetical protein